MLLNILSPDIQPEDRNSTPYLAATPVTQFIGDTSYPKNLTKIVTFFG